GQVGPVAWRCRIGTQQGDGTGVAFLAERLRCRMAGGTATDDDDGGGQSAASQRRRCRALQLLADECRAVAQLDAPARQVVQCGRPWRGIPAQAETGVMPWAADRVTDHETFGKWSAVVGAGCADRQHVVPAPDEQRGRIVDMAKEHGTVGKIGNRNTLPEIRATDRLSMLTHAVLPMIEEGERWPPLRSLPSPSRCGPVHKPIIPTRLVIPAIQGEP